MIEGKARMKPIGIGAIEIQRVGDVDCQRVDPHQLYSNLTPELVAQQRDALGPSLMAPDNGDLLLSYHSYVVRTRHHTIVVDTCLGNHKERPTAPAWHRLDTPYLARLEQAGVRPQDVDVVLCTHLHADHVGWNTRLDNGRWVPTFPNARYLIAQSEFAHCGALHSARPAAPVNRGSFEDSVLPVVQAGIADLVPASHRIELEPEGGVWLEPAPGHTPGNVNIVVRGGGRDAILCGDVIHHPIQLALPWLELPADFDRDQASATRRALLERCADTDIVLLTGHFPDPTSGRLRRAGDAFRFAFDAR